MRSYGVRRGYVVQVRVGLESITSLAAVTNARLDRGPRTNAANRSRPAPCGQRRSRIGGSAASVPCRRAALANATKIGVRLARSRRARFRAEYSAIIDVPGSSSGTVQCRRSHQNLTRGALCRRRYKFPLDLRRGRISLGLAARLILRNPYVGPPIRVWRPSRLFLRRNL